MRVGTFTKPPSSSLKIINFRKKTSVPIGAWKCNFPPFQEIMTDRQTDRQTERQTGRPGQIEVNVPHKRKRK